MFIAKNITTSPIMIFAICLFTRPLADCIFCIAHVDEALYTTTVLTTIKMSTTKRVMRSIWFFSDATVIRIPFSIIDEQVA